MFECKLLYLMTKFMTSASPFGVKEVLNMPKFLIRLEFLAVYSDVVDLMQLLRLGVNFARFCPNCRAVEVLSLLKLGRLHADIFSENLAELRTRGSTQRLVKNIELIVKPLDANTLAMSYSSCSGVPGVGHKLGNSIGKIAARSERI